jgi:hypothetical protein
MGDCPPFVGGAKKKRRERGRRLEGVYYRQVCGVGAAKKGVSDAGVARSGQPFCHGAPVEMLCIGGAKRWQSPFFAVFVGIGCLVCG